MDAGVSDCELSMVKVSRTPADSGLFHHVGCINNRVESTIGIVFNEPGIKTSMTLARELVTLYTKSSQVADRFAERCAVLAITSLKATYDLEIR